MITKDRELTLPDLKTIVTPPPQGPQHRPVSHYEAVLMLLEELDRRGLDVYDMELTTCGDVEVDGIKYTDTDLFGKIMFTQKKHNELAVFGFRHSNRRRLSFRGVGGKHVIVCTNLVLSGDVIVMKRKHTTGFDLSFEIAQAVDVYLNKQELFEQACDDLRNRDTNDREVRSVLYQMFEQRYLPNRLFHPLSDLYFRDSRARPDLYPEMVENQGNAYGVMQGITRSIRDLQLRSQMKILIPLDKPFRKAFALV